MEREALKLLHDMQRAAQDILAFTRGKDFSAFDADRMLQVAVEREFEIIGEAVNRLRRDFPQHEQLIPDAPQLIAFRNRLIHGYDGINYHIVWDVVQVSLPELLRAVESHLAACGNHDS